MKKFLTAILALCACALTATAAGCMKVGGASSSSENSTENLIPGENRAVTLQEGEGFTFKDLNVTNGGVIPEGSTLTFSIELGGFYTGNPIAYVNDVPVAPNADGQYSIPVGGEDIIVRVDGVRKDISNMAGSGTMDDAFVVTKPIDLVYIADQVNKGNPAYTRGSYILANDIDCKGEELKVIGDYSTEESIFSGCFSCVTNPETGEMQRYTISNFTINSENSGYVGLFGAVFADMTVTSSALFYGIRIENFTINAGVSELATESKTVSCGGLVGYGVGANLYLCEAKNGEINLTADQSYFSFAGGLIGYQQAFYEPSYEAYFPSEITYASVDVDVNVLGGMALYAGGIAGYLATNYPFAATASIHNSYALGSVNGALRSGGIAGGMGQYTVVSNCYATGEITARTDSPIDDPISTSDEYSYSYAGGLVGFAENDSIAHDCFFNGTANAYAISGEAYALASPFVAGGYEAGNVSIDSQKYLVVDCLEKVDLKDDSYLTEALGWQGYDWVFTPNALPEVNYGTADGTVALTMTIAYVAPNSQEKILVNDKDSFSEKYVDTSVQSNNSYTPIGSFFASGGLDLYYEADNGFLSYGYFFDEACTKRVPYSYLPMKNLTLYVGFADPTEVLGTYYFTPEGNTKELSITFGSNGIATYSDGVTKQQANYSFDGETLLLEGARLARYYLGEVVVDEENTETFADYNFDLYRYSYYNFLGKKTDKGIVLYDGVYFTESDPLIASPSAVFGEYYKKDTDGTTYYTFYGDKTVIERVTLSGEYTYEEVDGTAFDLSTLTPLDAFKGTWVKSATVNKTYFFDGAGSWEYLHLAYDRKMDGYAFTYDEQVLARASGEYTVVDGQLLFTHNGKNLVAKFDSDGFLEIDGGSYYRENSHQGVWQGSGYTLTLYGINEKQTGVAELLHADGYLTSLVYEASETSGVVALYYPHPSYHKDALYGYFTHDIATNTLNLVKYTGETESGYAQESLYLCDDYYGEWICNLPALQNVEFDFNGFGLYTYLGVSGVVTLTENGESVTTEYSLDSSLKGKFAYKGVVYEMEYDEDLKKVVITLGAETSLERKDEFANVSFVDMDGNEYFFDGKSSLTIGGKLTIDEKSYTYFPAETGYAVYDGETQVGTVVKGENHYLLTINENVAELYIANEFMGDWAISNQYALFHIGPTDTNGVIKANFKGKDVELTYIDPATLTFRYREDKMPITYYVFVIFDEYTGENVLVLSEFTNLMAGEYFICSKVNKLYGEWSWNRDDGKTTLHFDGVTSSYVNGYATITLTLNTMTVSTDYFYVIRENGIIMWSREPMAERTWYFRLDVVPESEMEEASKREDAFVLKNEQGEIVQVLLRAEVDSLYLTEAFDKDGNEYLFDGEGTLLMNGEEKYKYVVTDVIDEDTALLNVTDIVTGKTYEAILDYEDATHILFTLGEEVVEEETENA